MLKQSLLTRHFQIHIQMVELKNGVEQLHTALLCFILNLFFFIIQRTVAFFETFKDVFNDYLLVMKNVNLKIDR